MGDQVVVVGGGVVGLAVCLALRRLPVELSLVTPKPPEHHSHRRVALHLASQRFLASLGVWKDAPELQAAPYQQISVWEDYPNQLQFSARTIGQAQLGWVVSEPGLQRALWSKVIEDKGITIHHASAIECRGGQVILAEGDPLAADCVVAADGANSTLRANSGVAVDQASYEQVALVATIWHEKPHRQRLIQRFLPEGPLALLALQDPHQSSLVWTHQPGHFPPPSVATALENRCDANDVTDEQSGQAITAATQGALGRCEVLGGRGLFPLIRRHVTDYCEDNLIFVGDAAHTVHPLAGQGLNLGLMDAQDLGVTLQQAWQNGLGLNDPLVLKRFSRRRRAENEQMLRFCGGIKALFAHHNPWVSGLRQLGLAGVNHSGLVKRRLIRHACGLHQLL